MAFKDYMSTLPNQKEETIAKLAEITYSSKTSVYRWMKGEVVPPPLKQQVIAKYLNKTIEELFPAKEII